MASMKIHTTEELQIMAYLEQCGRRLHDASLTRKGEAAQTYRDAAGECWIIQTDILAFKHREVKV